jgi:hypothetical protein
VLNTTLYRNEFRGRRTLFLRPLLPNLRPRLKLGPRDGRKRRRRVVHPGAGLQPAGEVLQAEDLEALSRHHVLVRKNLALIERKGSQLVNWPANH